MIHYTILIEGKIEHYWKGWFGEMDFIYKGINTILSGFVKNEEELNRYIYRIKMLNLKLISVSPDRIKQ